MMKKRNGYIFTNKQESNTGIMSMILGIIAILSNGYAISKSYQLAGNVPSQFGTALALTALMAGIGFVLGVVSRVQKNRFYLFPYLGIGFNVVALAMTSWILSA